jgi:hypothetical protein
VDAAGNYIVSDGHNHRVMKWALGAVEGDVVAGGMEHYLDQARVCMSHNDAGQLIVEEGTAISLHVCPCRATLEDFRSTHPLASDIDLSLLVLHSDLQLRKANIEDKYRSTLKNEICMCTVKSDILSERRAAHTEALANSFFRE